MTPEEFYDRMIIVSGHSDTEQRHIAGDELMQEALESLGYQDGVDVFKGMYKWYA